MCLKLRNYHICVILNSPKANYADAAQRQAAILCWENVLSIQYAASYQRSKAKKHVSVLTYTTIFINEILYG